MTARTLCLGRRDRAHACDQRRRPVSPHEPADPAAADERTGADHQRVLGRHVHAKDQGQRPPERAWAVRRADHVRAHQTRAGDPHRDLGEAAGRHRRRGPLDAPGMVGHARLAILAAPLLHGDTTAAKNARTGRRHDRLARSCRRTGSQLWPVLARPPAAPHALAATAQGRQPQERERLWAQCVQLSGWQAHQSVQNPLRSA